ncbi:hypothetical protein HY639_01590 [Candidatus Woesearchaeota archaeon]|nr:hypothetical protein [Candidatus Woesearchaeota archaeon]
MLVVKKMTVGKIEIEKGKKYLQLGCGNDIRPGWTNCDKQEAVGIDYSFDFEIFPYPFMAGTFDYILMDNVLEHMLHIPPVVDELYRIAKPNATIHIIVPYFNCAGAYNDPTHHHYFNRRTFEIIFTPNTAYKIGKDDRFGFISLKLVPTLAGRCIPGPIRELISLFTGGFIGEIDCKVRVKK